VLSADDELQQVRADALILFVQFDAVVDQFG
jgi:hypothetical protein